MPEQRPKHRIAQHGVDDQHTTDERVWVGAQLEFELGMDHSKVQPHERLDECRGDQGPQRDEDKQRREAPQVASDDDVEQLLGRAVDPGAVRLQGVRREFGEELVRDPPGRASSPPANCCALTTSASRWPIWTRR